MPKLTEYPEAQSFDENDILIKDGTNGTKKIKIENVLEYMVDPTLTTPRKAADAKATKDAIDAVGEDVGDLRTQLDNLESDVTQAENDIYGNINTETMVNKKIVSVSNGANAPIRDASISIEAYQNGAPSHDNICPIHGFDSIKVAVSQNNLMAIGLLKQIKTPSGLRNGIIYSQKGVYVVTGKPSNTIIRTAKQNTNGTYGTAEYITSANASAERKTYVYNIDDGESLVIWDEQDTILETSQSHFTTSEIFASIGNRTYGFDGFADEVEVSLPDDAGTVYGGTLNIVSGELTVTHGFVSMAWSNFENQVDRGSGYISRNKLITGMKGIPETQRLYSKCNIATFLDGSTAETHFNTTLTGYLQVFLPSNTPADTIIEFAYVLDTPITYTINPTKIETKSGYNFIYADSGAIDQITYSVKDDYFKTFEKFEKQILANDIIVGLPVLYLTGDTSTMSKDNEVALQWSMESNCGLCTMKWQGSSSLAYAKKNYTIKFANSVDFGKGWGAQKKYNLKANYIDFSSARNVVSAKLWGQIVKSRTVQNQYLKDLPNGGATDGFPIIIALNGEYHGLYTLNIPKDKWMLGMTGASAYEGILGAEDHSLPTQFKATITEQDLIAETSYAVEYASNEADVGWMATSVSTAISAVMNADSAEDADTIEQYFDLDSVVDHYIFTCLLGAVDCTDKNFLLVTYNGTKWYMSEWDLDSTYGNHWTGSSYYTPTYPPTFNTYASLSELMNFVYTYLKPRLKSRYQELREGALSEYNVTNEFYNFCVPIPKLLKDMDAEKWGTIPATETNTLAQITNWYNLRAKYLDSIVSGW